MRAGGHGARADSPGARDERRNERVRTRDARQRRDRTRREFDSLERRRCTPSVGDWATQGNPAKFSFCFTENVADSPWPEYHTTKGFAAEENAVTVIAAEAPHNIKDNDSAEPKRFLDLTCDVLKELGHNTWYVSMEGGNDLAIVFCPDHAALLGKHGWSREAVRDYVFANAVRSAADIQRIGAMWDQRDWTPEMNGRAAADPQAAFPALRSPDGMAILVAGGPGQHSAFLPGLGVSRAVTEPIR